MPRYSYRARRWLKVARAVGLYGLGGLVDDKGRKDRSGDLVIIDKVCAERAGSFDKPCRSCLSGSQEACSQLGRTRKTEHVSQYTLDYKRGYADNPIKALTSMTRVMNGNERFDLNHDDGESIHRLGLY